MQGGDIVVPLARDERLVAGGGQKSSGSEVGRFEIVTCRWEPPPGEGSASAPITLRPDIEQAREGEHTAGMRLPMMYARSKSSPLDLASESEVGGSDRGIPVGAERIVLVVIGHDEQDVRWTEPEEDSWKGRCVHAGQRPACGEGRKLTPQTIRLNGKVPESV